jgi:Icc-related predicted phosphoesterase
MIRVAAVGDVHAGRDVRGFEGLNCEELERSADVLLIAGDLTQHGYREEAAVLARELRRVRVPVVAVLGNHDYHQGEEALIRAELEEVGVRVLEGDGLVIDVPGGRLGIAGVKGFGGGFLGACASEFGEQEMKVFVRHCRHRSESLKAALSALDCDAKLALTHYSPTADTLAGERAEIFPFLGSYMLGEAIDTTGCMAAFHGHAHAGTEHGSTSAGVPVFNVARPVIRLTYKIYVFRR